jgi:hypothetical protein
MWKVALGVRSAQLEGGGLGGAVGFIDVQVEPHEQTEEAYGKADKAWRHSF